MDEKPNYFSIIQNKIKSNRRRMLIKRSLLVILYLIGFSLAYYLLDDSSLMNVPEPLSDYLHNNTLLTFNEDTFDSFVQRFSISTDKIDLIKFIYYSSNFIVFLMIPGILSVIIIFVKPQIAAYPLGYIKYQFHNAMKLSEYLSELRHENSNTVVKKAKEVVNSIDLIELVSPFKEEWQRRYTYEWFDQEQLTKETKWVLQAIESFENKAISSIESNRNLKELSEAVDKLGDYLYLSIQERDQPESQTEPHLQKQKKLTQLTDFANSLYPIQGSKLLKESIFDKFKRKFVHFIPIKIKSYLIFSAIAAFTMVIGSMVFNVSKEPAFITWFTVVFTIPALLEAIQRVQRMKRPHGDDKK